ncbi:MFS transporter [Streptomyces otsuchiensis]|uniref:MFS transporter n=1 Tax=Streptomyces otsuchiensis TaxID=2681388 RepID=UPI001D132510|nr:MFS transporter [Streptomyces otsuchiensis]
MTDRLAVSAPGRAPAREWPLASLLTACMAFSMIQLFLLGALAPRLVDELDVSPVVLGLTTTVGFGTAALLSPLGGRIVDRVGPRRSLVVLLLAAGGALALIGAAPGPGLLLCAVALGGVPQALANPATNTAVLAVVPAERRGAVLGTKQSGVQLGALVAGLPLAALAGGLGWRSAFWAAAGGALLLAWWAWRGLPPESPRPATAGVRAGYAFHGMVARLAVFSLLLGAAIASVNTYLTLFGVRGLSMGATEAGVLVAVLGVAGVVGRVAWSRVARPGRGEWLPGLLALGAVGAVAVLIASRAVPALVWVGAAGVGLLAVSANAVTMVLVVQRALPGRAGHDSALVAAGFFAGFALGPPAFGLLAQAERYGTAWLLVACELAAAGAVALLWAHRDRRTAGR